MSTQTETTMVARLNAIAEQMADAAIQTNNAALQDYAYAVAEVARDIEEKGEPDPQANALLRVLKSRWPNEGAVVRPAIYGLPEGYLHVQFPTFECGIAPDGSVSS